MKYFLVFFGVFVTGVLSQGFLPPPFRPVPQNIQRRQLTQTQQTHILSDVQQHQHRYSVNQQPPLPHQRQSNVQIQPSVQLSPSILNQRLPNPNSPNVQFQSNKPSQQTQNNVRPIPLTNSNTNNRPTQNFGTQIPSEPRSPHQQRSVQNQLQQPQFFNNPIPNNPPTFNSIYQQDAFSTQQNRASVQGIQQQQQQQQQLRLPQFPQEQFQQSNQVRFPPSPTSQQTFTQPQNQQFGQFIQPQLRAEVLPIQQQQFNNFQPLSSFNPTQQSQFLSQPQQQLPQYIQQPQYIQPSQFNQQQARQQEQFLQKNINDEQERIKELQEKQKIIQKHEQFLQKQYQKQQAKVQQLHQEFLKKQQRIQQQQFENTRPSPQAIPTPKGRTVLPSEKTLFEEALQIYQKQYPTTTTTTTTTLAPPLVAPLKSRSKNDYSSINPDDLEVLLQNHRQKLYNQIKTETSDVKPPKTKSKVKSTKALGRDDLLKQLRLALAEAPVDLGNKNYSSMDLVLPNGEKVQVIRTTDPEIIKRANINSEAVLTQQIDSPTTPKPLSFEDIAKSGLLPPGADFELIKQSDNGDTQEVVKIPQQKKVTFVYLEEQDDGSYKVQGVKGNGDKETKTSGVDVDNIVKRIQNGEIQLPPPSLKIPPPQYTTLEDIPSTTTPNVIPIKKTSSVTIIPHSTPHHQRHEENEEKTAHYISSNSISRSSSTPVIETRFSGSIASENPNVVTAYTPSSYSGSTISASSKYTTPTTPYQNDNTAYFTGSSTNYATTTTTTSSPPTATPSSPTTTFYSTNYEKETTVPLTDSSSTVYQTSPLDPIPTASADIFSTDPGNELPTILKDNGLFAMAKYLRQSGLDSILNETGPYTIFVPTDKAFKALLVQLGGPERAEEKFKNNPRLLSGLLLHHVIPGSFEISTLQDEMTGVSLAGTQLRVNQYNMHDSEWNDVKVTTINGAMIVPDKQDIVIPQGVAHAVDRVMFPLPVGDILQTLQSDRERRFTNFLRALFASGMSDTLQNKGIKTYTVFAPTDAAFADMNPDDLNKLVTDKDASEELVKKHVVPGTLFTAGMRFYQVKDAMAQGKTITLQKNGGKIKVNEGFLLTSNIPTTNGVIHAIDALL